MGDKVRLGADISSCGTYRYRLWREWGNGFPLLWIMLNPSTADAQQDDPTIRKCVGFAKQWGFGRIEVVNLFALRSTSPKVIKKHYDPVGPDNDAVIIDACRRHNSTGIIAAWGSHGDVLGRAESMKERLMAFRPHCLGMTKNGHPRHPLYVKYDTNRQLFTEREKPDA